MQLHFSCFPEPGLYGCDLAGSAGFHRVPSQCGHVLLGHAVLVRQSCQMGGWAHWLEVLSLEEEPVVQGEAEAAGQLQKALHLQFQKQHASYSHPRLPRPSQLMLISATCSGAHPHSNQHDGNHSITLCEQVELHARVFHCH